MSVLELRTKARRAYAAARKNHELTEELLIFRRELTDLVNDLMTIEVDEEDPEALAVDRELAPSSLKSLLGVIERSKKDDTYYLMDLLRILSEHLDMTEPSVEGTPAQLTGGP